MPEPGVLLLSLSLGSRVASRDGEPFGFVLGIRLVHGLCALLVAGLVFSALIPNDAVVGMRHDVLSLLRCLEALTHRGAECSGVALTVCGVDRDRCLLQMHLPNGRHRRERDRDAEGENE